MPNLNSFTPPFIGIAIKLNSRDGPGVGHTAEMYGRVKARRWFELRTVGAAPPQSQAKSQAGKRSETSMSRIVAISIVHQSAGNLRRAASLPGFPA